MGQATRDLVLSAVWSTGEGVNMSREVRQGRGAVVRREDSREGDPGSKDSWQ